MREKFARCFLRWRCFMVYIVLTTFKMSSCFFLEMRGDADEDEDGDGDEDEDEDGDEFIFYIYNPI